jgi:hypothetical protein
MSENVPIALKKSFLDERKFLGPLMRFARCDVRDNILMGELIRPKLSRGYGLCVSADKQPRQSESCHEQFSGAFVIPAMAHLLNRTSPYGRAARVQTFHARSH